MTEFEYLPQRKVYSVSELTVEVRELMDEHFPDVRVAGEISNARRYPSGHWYFTLKDERAQLSCVCFRQNARYLKTEPEDGLAVVARGRISVYERRGEYQLIVESLEPQGLGALQLAFERLKHKLAAEGLFDAARKRPLPRMPRHIGIVTSPSGAAIVDMLRILGRRFPGLQVRLYPVRVQGHGAAAEIAEGIRYFSDSRWPDVVVAGRGGGSVEDLWAFNEETVARAIADCSVPLVSAVGHETDFTIADFTADLRAATPSAAAELVVPDSRNVQRLLRDAEERAATVMSLRLARMRTRVLESGLERAARTVERRIGDRWQSLDDVSQKLQGVLKDRLHQADKRLNRVGRKLVALDLRVRLARDAQRFGSASQRLIPAMKRALEQRKSSLAATAGHLTALSPLAILERGYAIVQTECGFAVRESRQVSVGEALGVRLHRGSLGVRVEHATPESPKGTAEGEHV